MNIIVCDEKHEPVYWDATTPEAFARSALAILTERWTADGYWYRDPDSDGLGDSEWAVKRREEQAQALAMSKEEIAKLPLPARQAVFSLRNAARRESAEDVRHREWYARAKACVEAQDLGLITVGRGKWARELPVAWDLLCERSDHEYEHVALVALQQAKVTVA